MIFKNLQSENLIRELCLALHGMIFLPMDLIVSQGDIAREIFFIVDGTVHVLANDKNTIAMTLSEGEHFGEVEVLSLERRRLFYVQAVTFCTVNALAKEQLDDIATVYPQIITQLEQAATSKKQVLDNFNLPVASSPFAEEQNRLMANFLNSSFASRSESSHAGNKDAPSLALRMMKE